LDTKFGIFEVGCPTRVMHIPGDNITALEARGLYPGYEFYCLGEYNGPTTLYPSVKNGFSRKTLRYQLDNY
jgi:hypothetical protein